MAKKKPVQQSGKSLVTKVDQSPYIDTIVLCGDVTDEMALNVIKEIEECNYAKKRGDLPEGCRIKMIINTTGGEIYSGLSIVSAMEHSSVPVDTYVFGSAFSMGIIIAMAGARRYGSRYSTFMWHGIKVSHDMAPFSKIKIDNEHFKFLQDLLFAIAQRKSKIKQKVLSSYVNGGDDYFMSAVTAKKNGVIDEIVA